LMNVSDMSGSNEKGKTDDDDGENDGVCQAHSDIGE